MKALLNLIGFNNIVAQSESYIQVISYINSTYYRLNRIDYVVISKTDIHEALIDLFSQIKDKQIDCIIKQAVSHIVSKNYMRCLITKENIILTKK